MNKWLMNKQADTRYLLTWRMYADTEAKAHELTRMPKKC